MRTGRIGRPPADVVAQGERRTEILRTAMELFTERGYAAISLGQIAEVVGVTKSALYNHVRSKESLYTEVVCDLLDRIAAGVAAASEGNVPFRHALRLITERAVLHTPVTADMDELMRDVQTHLSPEQQEQVLQAHGRFLGSMADLMRRGIEQGALRPGQAPELLGYTYRRLVSGFQGRNRQQAGFEASDALVDFLVSQFLSGAGRA
ncbi:MAG: transcriptional regulator, TetR family [Symbiobacteriaceae bacterium]|jgi:AcrR family transcriptional regulator|nr:transcriptional regulator, TetR family [Symbiobacteriaceae bacterium]